MDLTELDDNDVENLLDQVVSQQMASQGLKTLSYAYKQIPIDDLTEMMQAHHIESQEFRDFLEQNLTYLGTFGLEDPIRDDVDKSIQLIRYGRLIESLDEDTKGVRNQVNIRMITGDHIDTALSVAIEVGIITQEESSIDGIFMTGETFRESIGHYEKLWDEKD